MPTPTRLTGAPCWIDLYTSDPERATAFYGSLLGWTAAEADPRFGGYFTFMKDGKHVAGCMRNDGAGDMPDTWSVYLESDDVDRVAEEAAANGGTVVVPPMSVEENGRMAIVVDPGGAAIGAWQPDQMTGFELVDEPGVGAWFELLTPVYRDSVAFYERVFGWTTRVMGDNDEFRYTVLADGDGQRAGIMDASAWLPDGAPGSWSAYFRVDDADRAVERVEQLGGSVVEPAVDTPYGRLAHVADPTGARFKVVAGG